MSTFPGVPFFLPFLVWFVFIGCCIVYLIYLFRRFVIAVEKFVEKQV